MVIVGDLNVAASQQDVHSGLTWAQMYHPEEKAILAALLQVDHHSNSDLHLLDTTLMNRTWDFESSTMLAQDYTDVWRMQHPHMENAFTVWDERTNARFSNKVQPLIVYYT